MDHNRYPLFSEDVPQEFNSLYQTQVSEQDGYDPQTAEQNCHAKEYWAPFLGSAQQLDNTFLSTSDASTHAASTHSDSSLNYSTIYNHTELTPDQAWNYSYYWDLLSEPQQMENSASSTFDNQNFNPSFMSPAAQSVDSLNTAAAVPPSNLYSAMLKKGLNILPGFLNGHDIQQPKPEHSKKSMSQRRNSYPNSTCFNPATQPSVSLPLDPISLPRKPFKKQVKASSKAFQEPSQPGSDSVLNNSINVSCSHSSKCMLNVNNDFNKMTFFDEDILASKDAHRKREPNEKQSTKLKSKSKGSSSAQETTSIPCSKQDSARRSKPKVNVNKAKTRTERGKINRKRNTVPETDEPSPLFNLVFQIRHFVSQIPVQPLLVSLSETFVSLMGMSIGLLWVFIMLSCEWAASLFQLMQKWALWTWNWLRAHGVDLIKAFFLRIPNAYYGSSSSSTKFKNTNEDFNLPKTGEEAVQRLLKFKEADPYSILGITCDATDEDIKRSYKSQAILVHPDKNHYPGAEEAFKILASAFETLGNSESRALYDKENILNRPRSEASQEISEFLEKLKQNIEEAQSFLGCQNCGKTHKRYRMERTPSEARYCAACKDKHAAKEGDLWAETTMMGFKWHYYSYLDGAIYDVTEWVTCQPNLVSRVEANTHFVPCRLATPKNKNRSAAYSRMEDLKDLVDDLLNVNQNSGPDFADLRSVPRNGKLRTKRTAGGRKRK